MRWYRLISLLVVFSFTSLYAATPINLKITATPWQPFLNGELYTQIIQDNFDNLSSFNIKQAPRLNLTIEHNIKVLPNVGLQTNIREHKRRANIDKVVVFDSVAYMNGKAMDSQVDLTHRDHLFYYNVLTDALDVDMGMNIIKFDGRIVMRDAAFDDYLDFKSIMPGFYSRLQYDIPGSELYLKATTTFALNNNAEFNKSRLMLGWQSPNGVAIELGYQTYEASWQNFKDTNGQLNFEGLYTGMRFNF